jgi:hypothetical protein
MIMMIVQVLVAAAVIDGPLVTVTHQFFSRGSWVVTKQVKASSSPPPPSSSPSSSPPPPPLSEHDFISITITTTSLPNQETIAHMPATLPSTRSHQVQSLLFFLFYRYFIITKSSSQLIQMVTFDGVAAHDVQGIGHSWLSSHWHPAVAGD